MHLGESRAQWMSNALFSGAVKFFSISGNPPERKGAASKAVQTTGINNATQPINRKRVVEAEVFKHFTTFHKYEKPAELHNINPLVS
jgi:hypothetical protein